MARDNHSQESFQEAKESQSGSSFLNFELKEQLLAFINSFIEYFETLFLYFRRIAVEKAIAGVQAYIFLKVGLFFIGLSSLLFLGAFFIYIQRLFGGDPLPAALSTGALCLILSLLSLLLSLKKIQS
ncbi:hypothetical protein EHQ27_11030 [Leptospira wolffii]|uniref:Phage holin family protein n=1 Tax=Leptospira wolffii TaxID=409998 RepID=A0A2M9ZCD6_9LEPT|nr:hypothetical protein [Leptospira wolffii]PJZ66014.1 hypothetical protein CH371_10870 [Leptospira wolffii]TGK59258.1 hypothetical protein EHQ32_10730 [Leptospira wolffii]TGK71091.1 hypothetical protein EHQ27_11030 [Leptospira wolffii]TGK71360.1 hypothetical protein EHQ35_14615 [Leptospira wolffii]TGL29363.1 hypothetical protein EHQ57_10540 [Leptospira wolffii]